MKAAALLLALLCLDGAQGLRCHNCTKTGGASVDCFGAVTCPGRFQACASQVLHIARATGEHGQVVKTCIDSCSARAQRSPPRAAYASVSEMKVVTHCCTSDLCNGAAGRGPGAASGLLLLLLLPGALAALLGASP